MLGAIFISKKLLSREIMNHSDSDAITCGDVTNFIVISN